ncbi:threonine aldolase [Gaeumannomyces tritici R3-111a-1]|uniref:Threonine aldolase n=1 Tax=Gaeumannomyces tritici (strain R3-111a-1) TaxID=644352 RepID=J3NRU5_GAET3|nr:threonine aldolase [Gaeumannomyces tritici R3-111a-1]EJT78901.1 threonine aldolase [Gaeumannomyces tritici R3-111a-1]
MQRLLGCNIGAGVGVLASQASRPSPLTQAWRRVAGCASRYGPSITPNLGPSFNAPISGYHRFRPPSADQSLVSATVQNGPPPSPLQTVHNSSHRYRCRSIAFSTPASVQSYSTNMASGATLAASDATPAAPVANGKGASAWVGHHGAAGLDFRSDTMTTPTPAMLEAIQNCTLLDDVLREDPTTNELEEYCARITGKEAGLFVLSGTMGNQLAMRALLTQPPYSVLCDDRSHIYKYEAGGVSSLTGAMLKTIKARNGLYLTRDEIAEQADLDSDVHTCPTRVISLENTLGGLVMPLAEARRISKFARESGLRVHCDGARLWEAVASGAGSLPDYAACFDTISLCFSKGLGAPIGSILVGPKDVIDHARWVRKAIGGGVRQGGVLTAAARVAVAETFGPDPNGQAGLLGHSHKLAKEVEAMWAGLGGKMQVPVQTNMCWLDLNAAGISSKRFAEIGREEGLRLSSNRLIIHYQIYLNRDDAIPRLKRVMERAMAEGGGQPLETGGSNGGSKSQYQSH